MLSNDEVISEQFLNVGELSELAILVTFLFHAENIGQPSSLRSLVWERSSMRPCSS